MLHDLIVSLYGETTYRVLVIFFKSYPLWLPFLFGYIFWELWVRYVQWNFFATTKVTLLEIKLPKEITKSPAAMELVLNGFYQTGGEGTLIDKYWSGKTRAWFSAEIVSLGGEIHFFIWTRNNMRNIVEAHIYAQFSDVEVREVDDYAKNIIYDTDKYTMWAANYSLLASKVFPLKSYIDYGLDKNPKPENEVDPLGTVLEVMSNIKPYEQIWLQFVVRAHKKEKRKGFFSKASDWSDEVDKQRRYFLDSVQAENRRTLSTDENKVVDAMQRSLQKAALDTGIRIMYIAEGKGNYNNTTVTSLRGLFRPFSANFPIEKLEDKSKEEKPEKKLQKQYAAFNGLKANGTDTDFPWEDYRGVRMDYEKSEKLDAYKRRMFFYAPYQEEEVMVLTTESLATMFHFPSSSVKTPGLERIQSKRGQAPTNLPT